MLSLGQHVTSNKGGWCTYAVSFQRFMCFPEDH